jgi:hypothetical protein
VNNTWGNLQFFHKKEVDDGLRRFTLVVDVPTKECFLNLVKDVTDGKATSLSVKVGASVVSKRDQYSRKLGRQISSSRLMEETLVCEIVYGNHNQLAIGVSNQKYKLVFSYNPNKGKVYFSQGAIL